jgi:FkbM family methyltransferase
MSRMSESFAHLLRSLNSRLLYTQVFIVEKPLKVLRLISFWIYRSRMRHEKSPAWRTITNFDRNIRLRVDISRRMGAILYWTGFHELREMLFLHRVLKPDWMMIDAGANQGEFTSFAAKRLTGGKVIAYEPVTAWFESLAENVRLNSFRNVILRKTGLSDSHGMSPVYSTPSDSANEGTGSLFATQVTDRPIETIEVTTLDKEVSDLGLSRVDLIKLDIEGAEWPALRGAAETLRAFRPILLMEIDERLCGRAGYESSDLIGWLGESGYRMKVLGKRGELLDPKGEARAGNVVMIPE